MYMAIVKVEDVQFIRGDIQILQDVSWGIELGQQWGGLL